jgi:hypothetical protein
MNHTPKLFIGIGETAAFYTLRAMAERVTL